MTSSGTDEDKRLQKARQRIEELCNTINALDKARGGSGRKVRAADYLEGI